jgi:cell division protein FtsZ
MSNSLIKVFGVGGGGCNAVNHMYRQGIRQVDFIVANTDYQALDDSPVKVKIQLGKKLTDGRGAGNQPEQGKLSAIEDLQEIKGALGNGTKMLFITAGMGGGTGTGAAPVVAALAREMNILTVGIVSLPFRFEGQKRMNQALNGIEALKEHVDSLLIINNEKLREIYGDLTLTDAFIKADNVLTMAARGIAEIITVHGYINVDFADVETVMRNSGMSLMGSARAMGEQRAMIAVQDALRSPLLNNNNIFGASNILMNITSGIEEVTMSEIGIINDYVQESAGSNATIIWGNGQDASLDEDLQVTVIATGFDQEVIPELLRRQAKQPEVIRLSHSNPEFHKKDVKKAVQSVGKSTIQLQSVSAESGSGNEKGLSERSSSATQRSETASSFQKAYAHSNPLDEFEQIPAYVRKGLRLENTTSLEKNNISRYSLSEEDDGNIVLRKNSWLHDQVD